MSPGPTKGEIIREGEEREERYLFGDYEEEQGMNKRKESREAASGPQLSEDGRKRVKLAE